MKVLCRLCLGGQLPECHNGSWYDLKCAEYIIYKAGMYLQIPLGVAMKLPEGMEGWLLPRSSTFKKTGLLIANGMGIIDPSYCGDGDEWKLCAYATRDGEIQQGDRICQFRIMSAMNEPLEFVECDTLGTEDRGGIGSTGGYSAS